MSETAAILRRLRRQAGLSQTEIARRVGITQSAYSRLETGSRAPALGLLPALARALDTTPAELVGAARPAAATGRTGDARHLPLLGQVPAGPPAEAQLIADTYPVAPHLAGPDRYVLRVQGHSMSPEIKHGDHVVVQYLGDARPEDLQGRICICMRNGESTMKRLFVENRRGRRVLVLRGDNPDARPILLDAHDELVIQGRVVAVVGRDL